MSDTVQEIKDRLSIVDVVAPYVKLIKAGKHYKGLSPFNKEKSPSFFVSPDRGLYHCFSSGKGGDMFTFIEEMEGVDFRGALTLLAQKAGVEIVNEPQGQKDRREKIYEVLADAEEYFVERLAEKKEVQAYLTSRGLEEKTRILWRVGYVPREWRSLLEHLIHKGHAEVLVESAGLVKRPDSEGAEEKSEGKRMYDRFRGRIMFPIRDVSDRVIGFSGRTFPAEDTQAPDGQAKYINSPETSVFDKSRVLYGINHAKNHIRKYDFAVLVEGQFDLLMAHQAGYGNTMALSGTAFTEHHANLIKRYTENLVLAFDGDRAGVSASGRAASIALTFGLNVKIATLPPNEDPADVIQKNVSLWKSAIKEALHVVDFYLMYIKNSGYDERRFKLEVSRVVLPYIALITNAIDQSHFVSRVADTLGVPENAVLSELRKLTHTYPHAKETSHSFLRDSTETPSAHYEPFLSRGDTLERLLVGVMQSLNDEKHGELHALIQTRLKEILEKDRITALLNSPEEARVSLIEGDLFLEEHEKEGNLWNLVKELLDDLAKEMKRVQWRETILKLKHAEKNNDAEKTQALLEEINLLAREI